MNSSTFTLRLCRNPECKYGGETNLHRYNYCLFCGCQAESLSDPRQLSITEAFNNATRERNERRMARAREEVARRRAGA